MKKINVVDQLESFEELKEKSKETFKDLTPFNITVQNFSHNKFRGVYKTPYFSIDKRYTAKRLTSKKKDD